VLQREGTVLPSITARLLENASDKETVVIANAAGGLYGGGVDTTPSALTTFVMAMILYPDVLKLAQAEVDRVVGHDRLPIFTDWPQLPYVDAVIREVHRRPFDRGPRY
jgi:cytochrome P450